MLSLKNPFKKKTSSVSDCFSLKEKLLISEDWIKYKKYK